MYVCLACTVLCQSCQCAAHSFEKVGWLSQKIPRLGTLLRKGCRAQPRALKIPLPPRFGEAKPRRKRNFGHSAGLRPAECPCRWGRSAPAERIAGSFETASRGFSGNRRACGPPIALSASWAALAKEAAWTLDTTLTFLATSKWCPCEQPTLSGRQAAPTEYPVA
ncbi:MAG: hypothetical protein RI973_1386 [Bacteroidota bacterium]|jgi:hypothetical protein